MAACHGTVGACISDDEVGEVAKAADVFKENGLAKIRIEAEQKEAEKRSATQRRADMLKLADSFETAVGEIVQTVSSASTELEASASTLTGTAERSQAGALHPAALGDTGSPPTHIRGVVLRAFAIPNARRLRENSRDSRIFTVCV
jgi:hypothetical protein